MSQLLHALGKMRETDKGYCTYGAIVWDALRSGQRDTLRQLLFQGPVYDGNIVSKGYRDDLIEMGLATRCCFMGEQGYTAATYDAFNVFKQGRGEPVRTKPGSPR
jgi:hypothetical protein